MYTEKYKPGYQGHDAMRENAEKLLNHPGHEPTVYSKSAISKSKMRPFKEGGCVKRDKYAAGGVAKIRLGQSTASGMPKNPAKKACNRTCKK